MINPNQNTIVALATPAGAGAIGIIRLSGPQAIEICNTYFKGKNLLKQNSHTIHFGYILDNRGVLLDEVLVSIFIAPKSYTKENVVEISCHGSVYIQQKIIQLFVENGVRLAQPGEFTLRAFLNGKMDLSQAEAVADLIASESGASHEIALKQLRGGFSNELKDLRNQLIHFASLIELELDFAEEDVEFADRTKFVELLNQTQAVISRLVDSFQYGNVIKRGVPVAIVGKPNAGKSSLLNALLNEERAIVSDIPGTTRDSIEDTLVIDGVMFRFIDTAGLRKTDDVIEAIGVEKAKEKAGNAKIILYLFDKNNTTPQEIINDVKNLYKKDIRIILVQTKIDSTNGFHNDHFIEALNEIYPELSETITAVSIYQSDSIKSLKGLLTWEIQNMVVETGSIVTNARHVEALQKTEAHIINVQQGLQANLNTDLLVQDIRLALNYLGEITGEITPDDLLENIFSKFCIGK